MLDWVTSASRSQPGTESTADDAPETPAHVFAARAFKSLLFGTPAPNEMTVEKPKKMPKANPTSKPLRRHSSDMPRGESIQPEPFVSPSKGILVAPGSVSIKRKSVTFGSLGRDGNARKYFRQGAKTVQEEQIPVPMLKPFNFDPESIEEDLRKSLFSSCQSLSMQRDENEKAADSAQAVVSKDNSNTIPDISVEDSAVTQPLVSTERRTGLSEDQTVDLEQPRSASGQHWKREYEKDHDKSKSEMKKLIRYNQLTKSYAEKRDRDAVIMTQKLEEAEKKATSLETQIRKLAAQLMDAKTHGEEQDLILSEVASQTAEVMKQKGNAEKYRAALRKYEMSQPNMNEELDERAHSPVATDVAELKSELLRVRLAVDRAEARAAKAEYDKSMVDAKLHQAEASNKELSQQYNKLRHRSNNRAGKILEENRTLSKALVNAKFECRAVKEELDALKKASNDDDIFSSLRTGDKLFDLDHPRYTKEPSPPTSDEDLREKSRLVNRTIAQKTDPVLMDEIDDGYSYRRSGANRWPPHKKTVSSPSAIPAMAKNAARSATRQYIKSDLQAILSFDSDSEKEIDDGNAEKLVDRASKRGSPLMKSFVDNLGSRRVLPPERVAAAKKRLEEKAADRRSTPMYIKVQDKIIV